MANDGTITEPPRAIVRLMMSASFLPGLAHVLVVAGRRPDNQEIGRLYHGRRWTIVLATLLALAVRLRMMERTPAVLFSEVWRSAAVLRRMRHVLDEEALGGPTIRAVARRPALRRSVMRPPC